MASRRKRGPVAFRPRLLTGLAFSLQLLSIVEDRLRCRIINLIGTYSSDGNVRFGSLADLFTNISLMSAFEQKAAVQSGQFWGISGSAFGHLRSFSSYPVACACSCPTRSHRVVTVNATETIYWRAS